MRAIELYESRSRAISEEELRHLLATDYSDMDINNPKIYRGIFSKSGLFYLASPDNSDRLRTSRNTSNYATLLVDNSDRWANFPKRSKSFICSLDRSYASSYGHTYVVIPKNGSKIGVCEQKDFWDCFIELNNLVRDKFSLSSLNDLISGFGSAVLGKQPSEYDYDQLLQDLKQLQLLSNPYLEKSFFQSYNRRSDPLWQYLNSAPIVEQLENLLDPTTNGFRLYDTKSLPEGIDGGEVWTEGPVLLISTGWLPK